MNTIDIVEEYFGDTLTEETTERISAAPPDQLVPLVEKLDAHYEDWFSGHAPDEQGATEKDCDSYFYCLEPFPPENDGRALAGRPSLVPFAGMTGSKMISAMRFDCWQRLRPL